MFITFLSDFGLQDDFVGTCHGVIKRIAPDAQIIDITHGIPRQQILQGALVLANTIRYMPVGSHLAVIDPGVGGARRALALRDQDGRYYVGPDNGLLIPAVKGARDAVERVVGIRKLVDGLDAAEPLGRGHEQAVVGADEEPAGAASHRQRTA